MALSQLIPVMSASQLEAEQRKLADSQQLNPVIQGLAAHVQKRWESAKTAKQLPEQRLLQCLRQRNGEYDPDKLSEIRQHGGSEIFMHITSTKCRAAAAWLRDTLLGTGVDKPWSLDCTPIPDLPPGEQQALMATLGNMVQMVTLNNGVPPTEQEVADAWETMRDGVMQRSREEAKKRVDRMELKMEDQLTEGRFPEALSEFLEDVVTFPTAILKGPVARKRKTLKWQGGGLVPVEEIQLEWERVDPFMAYPAAWATSPQDGPFIERHRLTRSDIEAMIGLEGYSEPALRKVLSEFGTGMRLSLSVDKEEADATGKDQSESEGSGDVVDALQLWDDVHGELLKEWGVPDLEDTAKSYPCEVWLIGSTVVKAVLNYDPLGRKPYYATSYERIPGAFWGNGVADLIRDCQAMCNATARSLANNMGISSGPQVGVNTSRLPAGERITQMFPWKVWQFTTSDFQDNSPPIQFFQPQSNAQELLTVFDRFLTMADEVSGIPRYMQGEHAPGAGRTASGLSMLISNASKAIKSVIGSIDKNVIVPLLERLYQHNLRYSQDPDLIGDVSIVAKGAMGLVAKESAAVRRNELLQLVLGSPVVQQIVGLPGTAELLRENVRLLDINTDRIVPSRETLEQQIAEQEAQKQMMMQAAMSPEYEDVQFQRDENGAVTGATKRKPKSIPLQVDGSPQGGRDGSTMRNAATGTNG